MPPNKEGTHDLSRRAACGLSPAEFVGTFLIRGLWYVNVTHFLLLVCSVFSVFSSFFLVGLLLCLAISFSFMFSITFIYHSSLIRKVTNLFKNTGIGIAFRASNTIYQQLVQKISNKNPSGIYEIKCNTCGMNYVGQSGRQITTRHKEHIRYIKNKNPASAYAVHILNNRHEYGTTANTLQLIKTCRKSSKMNHWENMYTQIYRQYSKLIKEQQVNEANPLFEYAQPPKTLRDSTQQDRQQRVIHD